MNNFLNLAACGALTIVLYELITAGIKVAIDRLARKMNAENFPTLVPKDAKRMCDGPHKWELITLVLEGLAPGDYDVCVDCGEVPASEELMMSEVGMQQLSESLKLLALKDEKKTAIASSTERLTAQAIEQYVIKHFAEELNDAGYFAKLQALLTFAKKARVEAGYKAEVEAENELGHNHWTDKEGNA